MGKTEVIAEDNRLMKVCLLTAIGTGLTVLGDSYGTMLFLTYYKADSLPYLYVTLGLLSLATSQVLQNWQQKDMISCLKKSHIGFIITLLASFYLLVYEVAHAAFLLSLLTLATAFTILTSYWNLVSMIFDLREFKQLGRWILASSTLGGLIIGIIVPILLKFVPPNALLILFIVLIFLAYLLLLSVHVKKTQIIAPNKRTHSSSSYSLLRQPLFLYLFASYFLVIFTHISIDFNLKKELYLVYNEVQIGSFLAPFFAITMGITIIGQFFILPIVIRMTGVVGLIAICSIITLVGSLFVFQYPSLISATILTGFEEVARFTFYSMGLKMVINVFPQRARIEANFLLKNKARNISAILAAALLSIFVKLQWYQFIMILVFTVSIIMIFIAVKVSKYYYITLKNSINLHRFSDEYLTIKRTDDAFRNRVIKIAIEEKSEDAVIFALSLLQNQRLKEIPNYVMEQLNNKSILVRKLLIKIVCVRSYKMRLMQRPRVLAC